jgi:hypothetical protein
MLARAANRKATVQAYGAIARALAAGGKDDRQLALRVVDFVKAMPSTATRHNALVQRLRACKDRSAELSREQPRESERGAETGRTKE